MLPRHISVAFFTWYTSLLVVITCNDYKGFDDSVLYKINWPGADINPLVSVAGLDFFGFVCIAFAGNCVFGVAGASFASAND